MSFKFTYNEYAQLLSLMKQTANIYTFESFVYGEKKENGYILRHDVDLDLDKAFKMFIIEKNIGIVSTFFLLTTSNLYNINSKKNRMIISEMIKNGFEVGLHFDPTVYNEFDERKLEKYVREEANIIEQISGKKVNSISLHNPSFYNKYPNFNGYNNAYHIDFFSDEFYISDSCKSFRNKDIYKFIEYGKDNIIQVVFHPIHFSETQETYSTSFLEIIKNKVIEIDNMMKQNKTYSIEEPLLSKLVNTIHNLEIL